MEQKLSTAQQLGHLLTASRKAQAMTQARLSELENSPGRLSVERLLVLVNALGLELVLRSPVEKAAPTVSGKPWDDILTAVH